MTKIFMIAFAKGIVIALYGVVTDWVERRRNQKRSLPE
ncbi:hypothetical protein SPHV1_1670006 [Novosphingobium sp. KN65.2]|nr:hypothetical protein SPHV1_1670006 [Novosphingobium sp. KN65.2]